LIYLIALGAVALFFGVGHFVARRMMYEPARYPEGWWDRQAELGARDVWLRASDGVQLHAWWLEAPGSRLTNIWATACFSAKYRQDQRPGNAQPLAYRAVGPQGHR
jgi:hypothetical protein